MIRIYSGHRADRMTRAVVRLLGGRHLIQGFLTGPTPGTRALALGAAVDLAHAFSMLGVAMLNRSQRRAGLVDAAVAATLAAAGVVLASRASAKVRIAADA